MGRVALAAFSVAALWCGSAAASVTLDASFTDPNVGVSGSFHETFDSLPDGVSGRDAATANCSVTGDFTCDEVLFFSNLGGGFLDGFQVNLNNLDGSSGPGLAYSYEPGTLTTPGTFANENSALGHSSTLTVTVTGVPEPAAWTMLVGGFFGLGGLLRQRRGWGAAIAANSPSA